MTTTTTTTTRRRRPAVAKAALVDLDTHRRACQQPVAAIGWSDRCTCRHVRGRHDAARHDPIPTDTGVCTGRNLAGPCLWPHCPCTAYTTPTTPTRIGGTR
jgi:hypothetical protein